jgi:hypothetical protein
MELPKSRIGKRTNRKTIDGQPMVYEVIDEDIFLAPSNDRKAFCLHKLRFDDGKEQIRIAYYMIAEKPRMRGKWAFGQFAPMMTTEEMSLIYERAKAKGWI